MEFALSVTMASMLTPVVISVAAIPNIRIMMSNNFRPVSVLCHISFKWNNGGMTKATIVAAKPVCMVFDNASSTHICYICTSNEGDDKLKFRDQYSHTPSD